MNFTAQATGVVIEIGIHTCPVYDIPTTCYVVVLV